MLNRDECQTLDRITTVLTNLGSADNRDQTDPRAHAARKLVSAITAMRAGDWGSVEYNLANAEFSADAAKEGADHG